MQMPTVKDKKYMNLVFQKDNFGSRVMDGLEYSRTKATWLLGQTSK